MKHFFSLFYFVYLSCFRGLGKIGTDNLVNGDIKNKKRRVGRLYLKSLFYELSTCSSLTLAM